MFLPGVCSQSPANSEKNSRDFDKMIVEVFYDPTQML
ncbi:hypothetical protein M2137_000916 [Parabacteroides sp. PFB2-10]|nr:hypothetical protein [Parabacteroides sp. PFB2-10]